MSDSGAEGNDDRRRRPGARRAGLHYLLALAVACGAYAATIGHDFVWDDRALILENRYLRSWSRLAENLTGDFFLRSQESGRIGYWRPVVTLSYMIDRAAHGDRAAGFHLTNVALHAIASCLVLAIARRLPIAAGAALGAALLFALHPVHVESVAWVSGRTDLLCGVFFFAAIALDLENRRSGRRWTRWLSVVAGALAMLSKEMAATLPLVVALAAVVLAPPAEAPRSRLGSALRRAAPFVAIVALFAAARLVLLPIETPTPHALDAGRGVLLLTWWSALLEYGRVLVFPAVLSVNVEVELVRSALAWRSLAGLAVGAAALGLAWAARSRAPALSYALGWTIVTMIPLTNFLVPIQAPGSIAFPWSERFLYVPSAGFCVAMAWLGLDALPRRLGVRARPWALGLSVAVLVAAGARTMVRAAEWRNDLTLFAAALRDSPGSIVPHLNYGVALADAGRTNEADEHYRAALAIEPDSYLAHYNLGNLLRERGELLEAEREYRLALAREPDGARAHLNLGLTLLALGRTAEALREFETADAVVADYAEAKLARANALRLVGRGAESVALYEAALRIEPRMVEARLGLAGALLESGASDRGEELLRTLVAERPEFKQARLALAEHLDRTGRAEAAEREYREVLRLDPADPVARQRLRAD